MIGNASSYWQYRQKYSTIYEKDVSPTFYLLSAILTHFIKVKFRYCHWCRHVKQNDSLQVIGDFLVMQPNTKVLNEYANYDMWVI